MSNKITHVFCLQVALNSTRVNLSSFKKRKDALESTSAERKDGFSEEFEVLQQQVGGMWSKLFAGRGYTG